MLETRLPICRMSLYLLFYPGLGYVITARRATGRPPLGPSTNDVTRLSPYLCVGHIRVVTRNARYR